MGLYQRDVASLFKGVSRQEARNRVEGQVQESINCMHSIEKGVNRRNPTQLIAELEGVSLDSFIHTYSRGDGIEEYIFIVQDGELLVYDTLGVQRTVSYDAGALPYFTVATGTPIQAFRAITIGDTTFLINKTVETALSLVRDGTLDEHLDNAIYWLKRSFDNGGGSGYVYNLQGQTATGTSSTSVASTLAGLVPNCVAFGSSVISKVKPTAWVWSDSYGNQASEGFWGTALKIEDLPRTMSGAEDTYDFLIKITGDPDNAFTVYWVKYEDGHWKETRAPYLQNTIDNTTMPLKIVSEADGTFTVSLIEYGSRMFGDEITAKVPSFIGNTIQDVFFYKNRLCFLSSENSIMSETAEYFNFFPTTVTDILDGDPIDVAVDSNSVALLKNAVAFNNEVILLSENAQFSLRADKILSPSDASISNTTSYNSTGTVRPISLGNSMFFLSTTLAGTALREYSVTSSGASNIAVDVSGHVAGYIPPNVIAMTGSTNQDIIMLLSSDERDAIYIYKFFNDSESRLQTAWFKWKFNGIIINISVLKEYLYILINRNGVVSLEKLDYSNSQSEVYLDNGIVPYESYIELAELVLKDTEGKVIQSSRAPLLYKTLKVVSKENTAYEIEVTNSLRTRVAKNFAVRDNKVLLQGKSTEVSIKIKNSGFLPMEFHTYAFEVNHNLRAGLI